MIVLKGTSPDVNNGKIKGVYHSEFLSYDRKNGLYVMRLHAKARDIIPDAYVDVAMTIIELEAMSDTNHIKEAYDYALKVSEGYRPKIFTLYSNPEKSPEEGFIDYGHVDMDCYIQLDDGVYIGPNEVSKVYWYRPNNCCEDLDNIYEALGGKDHIINDLKEILYQYENNENMKEL